jgi:hypothetical protein
VFVSTFLLLIRGILAALRQKIHLALCADSRPPHVEEVERLRWRIWNGKTRNANCSIDRVRKVMHVYKEERVLSGVAPKTPE